MLNKPSRTITPIPKDLRYGNLSDNPAWELNQMGCNYKYNPLKKNKISNTGTCLQSIDPVHTGCNKQRVYKHCTRTDTETKTSSLNVRFNPVAYLHMTR